MPTCMGMSELPWPKDVGILAIEIYFPSQYVCQEELEEYDKVSKGKYTIGLGQKKMGFCNDIEDINSLCLTVFSNMMEKNNISYDQIGRVDVGTETIIDKSKSLKSVLMQLFEMSSNTDVEGVDNVNACYGGTAALFNAINWIESSSWDGRYAVVVCGDIAVYGEGPARPTGGAGSIAMLIGKNAPLVFERGVRSSHMTHAYDFYKPNLSSEYPVVDGQLSIKCYFSSLETCYRRYLRNAAHRLSHTIPKRVTDFDFLLFHSPYCKLVQKAFGRLFFQDFLSCSSDEVSNLYPGLEKYRNKTLQETYFDKDLEKTFMNFSQDQFQMKTKPTLLLSSSVGNMYTPSLYSGLVSILTSIGNELAAKRIGLFSYGSGLASSFFSILVTSDKSKLEAIVRSNSDILERLNQRTKVNPETFTSILKHKKDTYNIAPLKLLGNKSDLSPGTFYLTEIDESFRRKYARIPPNTTNHSTQSMKETISINNHGHIIDSSIMTSIRA